MAASSRIEAQAGSPNHDALIAADAGVSAGDWADDFAFLLIASASSGRARQSRRAQALHSRAKIPKLQAQRTAWVRRVNAGSNTKG